LKAEIKIQNKIDCLNLNQSEIDLTRNINQQNNNNTNNEEEGGELGIIREESLMKNANLQNRTINNNSMIKNSKKIQIMSHYHNNNKEKVGFNDIPNEFLIKNILFFLDVHSLPKFGGLSKKTNECMKTHMIIRVFFLNKEKLSIEKDNNKIIQEIEGKRRDYFDEYEILPPSKENALEKIKSLNYYVSL
jgi:hypothetical protein